MWHFDPMINCSLSTRGWPNWVRICCCEIQNTDRWVHCCRETTWNRQICDNPDKLFSFFYFSFSWCRMRTWIKKKKFIQILFKGKREREREKEGKFINLAWRMWEHGSASRLSASNPNGKLHPPQSNSISSSKFLAYLSCNFCCSSSLRLRYICDSLKRTVRTSNFKKIFSR